MILMQFFFVLLPIFWLQLHEFMGVPSITGPISSPGQLFTGSTSIFGPTPHQFCKFTRPAWLPCSAEQGSRKERKK